jgi:hypothetical protein
LGLGIKPSLKRLATKPKSLLKRPAPKPKSLLKRLATKPKSLLKRLATKPKSSNRRLKKLAMIGRMGQVRLVTRPVKQEMQMM